MATTFKNLPPVHNGANLLCQEPPIVTVGVSKVKYWNKWCKIEVILWLEGISTTSFIKSLCMCVMCPDGKATGRGQHMGTGCSWMLLFLYCVR